MEHILATENPMIRLKQLLKQDRIKEIDNVWQGKAGDYIIGDVPQDEDADSYILQCQVSDWLNNFDQYLTTLVLGH